MLVVFLRIHGADNENRRLPLREKLAHMDPLGCVVFIGSICCLLLALQWGGQTKPWRSSTVIGLFVGSGLLSCIFAYIQWRMGERAMIPLRVLRQRSILAVSGVNFCLGAAAYVLSYYMPFYFQAVQGLDASVSGVRLMALFLPEMVALVLAGAIVTVSGYYVSV